MADTVPVEGEKVVQVNAEAPKEPVPSITTSDHEEVNNVIKITDYLAKTGHPQPPERVSAGAEADIVLAKVEEEDLGAKVVNMGEWVNRQKHNLMADLNGTPLVYHAEGKKGLDKVLEKASKLVRFRGKPVTISNPLADKKAA